MYKKLVLFPCLALIAGCGVSSSEGVMSRNENKGGLLGMSTLEDVKVDGASALEGVQDVVIGSFKVGFVESAKQTNQAKGSFMSSAMGGKARGNVTLEGVSDQTKQEITNAAYADFMQKLKSAGFNVVDRSVLTTAEKFDSMGTKQFPYVADSSGFLSEYGQTVFFQPAALGATGVTFTGDFPQTASGFSSAINAQGDMKVAGFATDNNIGVLSATYVVDFAAAGGHKGVSSASVVIGQNLAVTQASVKIISGVTSTFNNGMANIYLGQPIQSGQEFGEVIDDTSGANVALQEAANVATLFMGQGTNRSRNYIIQADPALYKEQSLDVLTQTNSALLNKTQ